MKVIFAPYLDGNPYQPLLAQALAGRGVTVIPSGPKDFPEVARDTEIDAVHLHWLHPMFVRGSTLRTLRDAFLFVRRLRSLKRRGVSIFWTAHNVASHEGRFPQVDSFVRRRVLRLANGVFVHNEAALKAILDTHPGASRDSIRAIPHGSYIGAYENSIGRDAARRELGLPADQFVFLSLGFIRPYKGVMKLIRCFRRLPQGPRAALVIAGKPILGGSAEELREAAEGDPRVTILPGYVPGDRLQIYFNAADAVVLPYLQATTSGALVLAMSFGKPLVLPDAPWVTEAAPCDGAILYGPDLDECLVRALQCALDRRDELCRMGAICLERARELTWSEAAETTLQAYRASASDA